MAKQIDPKPTKYRGVLYESRLEARWAILFDNSPNVVHFEYHPTTWKTRKQGWKYTPDFGITYCIADRKPAQLFLEIKPVFPTADYISFLIEVSKAKSLPLLLTCGPIFGDEIEIETVLIFNGNTSPVPILKILPNFVGSYLIASKYRFDI
jgi:hypothetical protein